MIDIRRIIIGILLIVVGIILGVITFAPGYCNTSSGYCIENGLFRVLVSSLFSGGVAGSGGILISQSIKKRLQSSS